jgi:histone H3/H4
MEHSRHKTLSSRDVQSAARMFFVGSLAKHATVRGVRAVTRTTTGSEKGSSADQAGLIFSPARIRSVFKTMATDKLRISAMVPVYLAAVVEYLIDELLVASVNLIKKSKRSVLTSDDIREAIRNDSELQRTLCRLEVS